MCVVCGVLWCVSLLFVKKRWWWCLFVGVCKVLAFVSFLLFTFFFGYTLNKDKYEKVVDSLQLTRNMQRNKKKFVVWGKKEYMEKEKKDTSPHHTKGI